MYCYSESNEIPIFILTVLKQSIVATVYSHLFIYNRVPKHGS